VTALTPSEVQAALDKSPFIAFCGMRVVSLDHAAGEITMSCPMRPEFERGAGSGQWHGGPMAAIIDTVGDYALAMLIGRGLPTVNFRVDYLRPAMHTAILAVAKVRRNGRTVGVADVDLFDERGTLLAIGRATYATAA